MNLVAGEKAELGPDLRSALFHKILDGDLTSLIQAQQPDQLNGINMQLGPHLKSVNLYVPLASIILGDTQGNQWTGCHGFTRMECPCLSMICDCTSMNASSTGVCCNRIKQSDVKALVCRNSVRSLYAKCQHTTNLVFFQSWE